jgi:hypothetical protein
MGKLHRQHGCATWDSGNYDAAYAGGDPQSDGADYLAGWYSSYELDEIGDEEHREVVAQWRKDNDDV